MRTVGYGDREGKLSAYTMGAPPVSNKRAFARPMSRRCRASQAAQARTSRAYFGFELTLGKRRKLQSSAMKRRRALRAYWITASGALIDELMRDLGDEQVMRIDARNKPRHAVQEIFSLNEFEESGCRVIFLFQNGGHTRAVARAERGDRSPAAGGL